LKTPALFHDKKEVVLTTLRNKLLYDISVGFERLFIRHFEAYESVQYRVLELTQKMGSSGTLKGTFIALVLLPLAKRRERKAKRMYDRIWQEHDNITNGKLGGAKALIRQEGEHHYFLGHREEVELADRLLKIIKMHSQTQP